VALAIATASGVAWAVTARTLHDQVDAALLAGPASSEVLTPLKINGIASVLLDPELVCSVQSPLTSALQPLVGSIQLVRADGTACTPRGMPVVPVRAMDVAAARGEGRGGLRDARAADGTHLRVAVRPFLDGYALVLSRDLTPVDTALRRLGVVLLLVSALGVLGALGTGLLVARAALRPVEAVTRAAEHVADTQDLDVPIPTHGHDELARLARAFNRMTAALATARRRQRQLVADLSHELRTPITSLRTNIELLARSERTGRPLPEQDRRELLDAVVGQLAELGSLVTELTVLARDETDIDPVEDVRWDDVVRNAVERAGHRGAQPIGTDLEPWTVRGDPAALERAVLNLLDNAVKFSPPTGRVLVRLHGGTLEVSDEGPGIPQDEREHVFERFWRSPAARAVPGSGLGLAIVADTARRHGGRVDVLDAPGGGATIRLWIPGRPTADSTGTSSGRGPESGH
jgi:two-component system sensor histidine kinase MprB